MKFFSNQYRYVYILGLGIYSYINTAFVEVFHYYGITARWWILLIGFIMICAVDWEGSRIAEKIINKTAGKKRKIHPSLLLFAISVPIALAAALLTYYVIGILIADDAMGRQNILLKLTIIFSFRVNLFLQCINTILFYLSGYKQKQLEAEELKRISVQAKLRAIQEQVNPHFLFNNLNVLSTLVLQKHEEANTFIEAFSSVYRYLLRNRDSEMVKLSEEIEFVQPYIYLLTTRFGNALKIDVDIPAKNSEKCIVPAALQLLIENAIKHNIASSAQPLTITITTGHEGYLEVINNLQEKQDITPSTGLGLENINQRYRLLAGKEIKVEKGEKEFRVSIPLLDEIGKKGTGSNTNKSIYESIDNRG